MLIKMPESYKGRCMNKKDTEMVLPREWTPQEEEWCWDMKQNGYSDREIAVGCDRDIGSVQMKMNRLRQQHNTYNNNHVQEKYSINDDFLRYINPTSVLDVYCGVNSYYVGRCKRVTTNDKNKHIKADYNMDALKCLAYLYSQNKKFDIVDLDPFGSAIECFDIALPNGKKGYNYNIW